MNIKLSLLTGFSLFALAGCAGTYSTEVGMIDPEDFGEANRQTFAAMIVDPDPVYVEPMQTSAEQAAAAIKRYREGQVVQPEAQDTTSVGGGGGGGSSGGS